MRGSFIAGLPYDACSDAGSSRGLRAVGVVQQLAFAADQQRAARRLNS